MPELQETAASLVATPKGILAADESIATMSKRLEGAGVPASETARRDYRELLLTTSDLQTWVAGIIWCDETLRQRLADGTPFPEACAARGIQAGIKVDTGVVPLAGAGGAPVTQGLDGLPDRLAEYREMGASFAKWRAVLDPQTLSPRALHANAHALARYAAACQEADIVPIVEPEVLMDGAHGIDLCQMVTTTALTAVFDELHTMGVDPGAMVLKPNMVVAGTGHEHQPSAEHVAGATLSALRGCVPGTVPGIAFLSGGQSNEQACANLAAINESAARSGGAPWRLTFSFGRALVSDALRLWHGDPDAMGIAQQALAANCARAAAASTGTAPGPDDHRHDGSPTGSGTATATRAAEVVGA